MSFVRDPRSNHLLAAMPDAFERHGVRFGRPWLGVPAQALRNALMQGGHAFIDDPTNADTRFTRNRIRQHLLPVWRAQFPAYQATLARSARHAAPSSIAVRR